MCGIYLTNITFEEVNLKAKLKSRIYFEPNYTYTVI